MTAWVIRAGFGKKNSWNKEKPLDKLHLMWYNEYSQEGGGNHDTRTALMKATSPIKIFKEFENPS
jgi:hypothetical protein